jgi:hypothetical protein
MKDEELFGVGLFDPTEEQPDEDGHYLSTYDDDAHLMISWADGGGTGPEYLRGMNPTDQLRLLLAAAESFPEEMDDLIGEANLHHWRTKAMLVSHIIGQC